MAEKKGGSRPDKVGPITYSSARKALLAPSPDNRGGLNVGLVSLLCEGVPGSTNKAAFTKKKRKHWLVKPFSVWGWRLWASATSAETLNSSVASYKYWQIYFHEWPWSITCARFRFLPCLMCGSKAPAVRKWLTTETFPSCAHNEENMQSGSLSNESREFSQHCLSLSFILPSESLMVFLLHQRIIHLLSSLVSLSTLRYRSERAVSPLI